MSAPARPRVLIISTGGTILSKPASTGAGYSPHLTGAELIGFEPNVLSWADVDVIEWSSVLSFAFTPESIVNLSKMVTKNLAEDKIAGAVIIQGTATMEETAFLADLLHTSDKPLVFTGAMYSASERDSDGPRNVLNSIIVASSNEARGKGVLVCMNGEIHAARDVIKTHKSSIATFKSPNIGPIGLVNNKEGAIFYTAPLLRRTFNPVIEPYVDLIKAVLGSDARLLKASVNSGSKGIVIEAFPGGGGVTPAMMEYIIELRSMDFPIVVTPRSILGRPIPQAGGGSGPADLQKCGAIFGGDLSAPKARILLMVALGNYKTTSEIRDVFAPFAPIRT